MAEEASDKSEEATSKKLEDARKEGNVPNSKDTSAFITLVISLAVIWIFFGYMVETLKSYFRYSTSQYGVNLQIDNLMNIATYTMLEFILILLPLLVPIMVAGIIANVVQIGFNFTLKPLTPKLSKISMFAGLKRLFSMEKLIDGLKMTFKAFITLGTAFYMFFLFSDELKDVVLFNYFDQLEWLKEKAIFLIGIILTFFLVFAGIDFAWTRHNYKKKLKMTKQQVKEEMKSIDGNPEIKQRIRQIQMESSKKRMLIDAQSADVVITNPTHYSVALRYDNEKEDAPRVVAKGVDVLAFKIRDIAKEHNIPIVQRPPLARELYKVVNIDQQIPPELFTAVVDVLVMIQKANRDKN